MVKNNTYDAFYPTKTDKAASRSQYLIKQKIIKTKYNLQVPSIPVHQVNCSEQSEVGTLEPKTFNPWRD